MTVACAIYLGGTGIALKKNPFGKDVANLGLYRALARYAPGDAINFLSFNRMDNNDVAAALYPTLPATKSVLTTSVFNPQAMSEAGTLLRASADLADLLGCAGPMTTGPIRLPGWSTLWRRRRCGNTSPG